MRRSKRSKNPFAKEQPLVPVTAEELHFAAVAAEVAGSGRTPRKSFASGCEEAAASGKLDGKKRYLVLRDDVPENHMAFAVMDAFPEKTPEGEARRMSLLWRVMRALPQAIQDPRSAKYLRNEGGRSFIAKPLLAAIGTTSMKLGEEVPIDAIFAYAEQLVQQSNAGA